MRESTIAEPIKVNQIKSMKLQYSLLDDVPLKSKALDKVAAFNSRKLNMLRFYRD
jgi:hypothetical protein